ncbi:translocation/assembly module TamB domain-containing protein [Paraglaciecola sp. 2405UD69-4]|uniref:autotransporter assembly complex protein TamB n=1 Tax=Paraglaciecola sp. 2405UD69-4 TaxID=3391836 RepID=UPI0039C90152
MSNTTQDTQSVSSAASKRKMIKVFYRIILALLITLVLICGFAFTPLGARLVVNAADNLIEPLHLEYGSGGLSSELHLIQVNWQDETTQAAIHDLKVSISFECIWNLALCVESLNTSKVLVTIAQSETTDTAQSNTSLITLPIPVSVKNIDIGQISVSVDNTLDLSWQQLTGELTFYNQLHVQSLQLQDLSITTYASQTPEPKSDFNWASWQYQPISSMPISLPIYFDIQNFEMLNTQLNIAEQAPILLKKINLEAEGKSKLVTVKSFYIEHELGHIQAQGDLQLNEKLSHDLSLDGQGFWPENTPVDFALKSKGSIEKLVAKLRVTRGDVSASNQKTPQTLSFDATAELSKQGLPLNASLNWNNLGWPLDDMSYVSETGSLTLGGSLASLKVNLHTKVIGQTIPDAQLKLTALAKLTSTQKALNLNKLLISTLEGSIDTTGTLDFANTLKWQGITQVQNIKPETFWPDIQADINGRIPTFATNSSGSWELDVNALDINGTWQNYPLAVTGGLSFVENGELKIRDLLVENSENQLFVKGSFKQNQGLVDVQVNLKVPQLADSLPNAEGTITLDGGVSGSIDQPEIHYQLAASDLNFADISVEDVTGAGQLKWDDTKPLDIWLTLSGIQGVNNQVDSATLSLKGNALSHNLAITATGETTSADVQVTGQLNENNWHGRWLSGELNSSYVNLSLVDDFEIQADWGKQEYSISQHCWRQLESELCIKEAKYLQNTAYWDLAIKDFNLLPLIRRFAPSLPLMQTNSRLALTSSGSWNIQSLPSAQVNMQLSPANWVFTEQNDFELNVQDLSLSASLDAEEMQVDLSFIGQEIGKLSSSLKGQPASLQQIADWPINGELQVSEFNLAPFRALVPQLEALQGVIQGQSKVQGSLSSPQLFGELAFVNGELKGESLPVWLSDIQQTIMLKGNSADFTGSYRLGKGAGELNGQIAWAPSLSGNVNISGNALEFDYQNTVKAKVSPDINIEFAANNVAVIGEVSLPYARVKVRDLPQGAESLSDDVILVEREQKQQQSAQQLSIDLLIKVDPLKANEVKLDAFGLTTDLQGQLRIRNKKADLLASGEVQLVNGKYKAYGQNLIIREGDILFNSTLDKPYLNVEAIRDPDLTEDDVVAGLRVEGGVESPTVTVFSEPDMEQQQSLSYILTGRGLGDSSDDSQDTILTNLLLSLGLGQSENLVSKVGSKLGFEDVSLDTSGQGDETQLSLTGTISPGVQLRYGVGVFDSESEVAIRYELLPKLYLEAVSGLESTLDIYYQFSLGDNENKQESEE